MAHWEEFVSVLKGRPVIQWTVSSILWYHGAFHTRVTDTITGQACMGDWSGMGFSVPQSLTLNLWGNRYHWWFDLKKALRYESKTYWNGFCLFVCVDTQGFNMFGSSQFGWAVLSLEKFYLWRNDTFCAFSAIFFSIDNFYDSLFAAPLTGKHIMRKFFPVIE